EQYAYALECAAEHDATLETIERQVLSIDHCGMLTRALTKWGFSRELFLPLSLHHATLERMKAGGGLPAAPIIALADRLAAAMLLGDSGNAVLYDARELLTHIDPPEGELIASLPQIAQETDSLKLTMAAHASASDWPDQLQRRRGALKSPVNALVVGAASLHPICVFFERISDRAGVPNLAVLAVRRSADVPDLLRLLGERERAAEASSLPLLAFSTAGDLDLSAVTDRRAAALRLPARIDRVLSACNALISE
ncbi:MAG: hypothetical protein D6744_18400, partial [Planctomycetota bacterium]